MPREPNDSEARGMWDVTRPNQQRNAQYGDRWPDPYVPYFPAAIAFSRSTGAATTGIYTGVSNGNGTNIGSGYPPLNNGWGFSNSNNDAIDFTVSTTGSQTTYTLDWIMLPRPYAGSNPEYNDVAIIIGTQGTFSTTWRVYEDVSAVVLANSWGVGSYQKFSLPTTGSTFGTTTLNMNTTYSFGLSWSLHWNDNSPPYASYFSANSQSSETHTHPNSGDNITMSWQSFSGSYNSWAAHPSNNGTSSSSGQNYLFGISI